MINPQQGADFQVLVTVLDHLKVPIDVSAAVCLYTVKPEKSTVGEAFSVTSEDEPEDFGLSEGEDGKITITVRGSWTAGLNLSATEVLLFQAEAVVGANTYRSEVLPVSMDSAIIPYAP